MNLDKSFFRYFKGTSLNVENWFEYVFVLLSQFSCPEIRDTVVASSKITAILATTLTLFENRIKYVFGAFMLLITFDKTMSNDFLLEYVKGNPSYLGRVSDGRLRTLS